MIAAQRAGDTPLLDCPPMRATRRADRSNSNPAWRFAGDPQTPWLVCNFDRATPARRSRHHASTTLTALLLNAPFPALTSLGRIGTQATGAGLRSMCVRENRRSAGSASCRRRHAPDGVAFSAGDRGGQRCRKDTGCASGAAQIDPAPVDSTATTPVSTFAGGGRKHQLDVARITSQSIQPRNEARTYSELARGDRFVGARGGRCLACGQNPIPLIVLPPVVTGHLGWADSWAANPGPARWRSNIGSRPRTGALLAERQTAAIANLR